MHTLQKYSPAILRIGLSLVFLWFGIDQIIHPNAWLGFIPDWVVDMSSISAPTIVFFNGLFEIIFGTALLFGIFTRFVAFILFLHMAHITIMVGLDSIGVRDFGLSIAMLVVWINGRDLCGLDNFIHRKLD
jgi:uncharacterized membrane protein YphA (DoxX/SURF4 family)